MSVPGCGLLLPGRSSPGSPVPLASPGRAEFPVFYRVQSKPKGSAAGEVYLTSHLGGIRKIEFLTGLSLFPKLGAEGLKQAAAEFLPRNWLWGLSTSEEYRFHSVRQ